MKIDARLVTDKFRYDRDHDVHLLVSLTAPAHHGEHHAAASVEQVVVSGSMDVARMSLGTEQCDPRRPYGTDVVVAVSALAGHKIDRFVSEVDSGEQVDDGTVTVRFPSILAGDRRDLVIAVKLKAQKKPLPRAVNVFDVKLAFDTGTPDGKNVRKTAETKAKARFVKPGEESAVPNDALT